MTPCHITAIFEKQGELIEAGTGKSEKEERKEGERKRKRKSRKAYRGRHMDTLTQKMTLSLSHTCTHTHTHSQIQRKIRVFPVMFLKCCFHLVAIWEIASEDLKLCCVLATPNLKCTSLIN